MTISELTSYLELARQYGVTYMKLQDVEFNLDAPRQPIVDQPTNIVNQTTPIVTPQSVELSDEDMLFYSVETPFSKPQE